MKKHYFFKSVSASTITFEGDGGTPDITITSNADWSVSNLESGKINKGQITK